MKIPTALRWIIAISAIALIGFSFEYASGDSGYTAIWVAMVVSGILGLFIALWTPKKSN
jgi:hypothetical protein